MPAGQKSVLPRSKLCTGVTHFNYFFCKEKNWNFIRDSGEYNTARFVANPRTLQPHMPSSLRCKGRLADRRGFNPTSVLRVQEECSHSATEKKETIRHEGYKVHRAVFAREDAQHIFSLGSSCPSW